MSSVAHVLDTSALLAHYFDEPGADILDALWQSSGPLPAISAVSVTELRTRLAAEGVEATEAERAAHIYLDELTTCIPVDRAVAEMAWQIRVLSPDRLPLADALIAATARAAGAVLVHRDRHMAQIPHGLIQQVVLPG